LYFEIGVCRQRLPGRGGRLSPSVREKRRSDLAAGILFRKRGREALKLLKSHRIGSAGCYNR